MKIVPGLFVAIDYTLTLEDGEMIDRSEAGEPLAFILGAGQIIPGLERALEGMSAGESAVITVEPEDAYGPRDAQMIKPVPRDHFPEDAELVPGTAFEANGPHGELTFWIHAVEGEMVVIDFNHPLAGKKLTFDVTVREVREATPEEQAEAAEENACGCGGGCGCGEEDGDESAAQGSCGGGCCG
jgi:FKBP-type peptidyl-prolyl cis-trans isomerase SlyD